MEDPRCCGTGTCIINEEGLCWCGQRWDGERMRFAEAEGVPADPSEDRSARSNPRSDGSAAQD
jgi:hypothetical protein